VRVHRSFLVAKNKIEAVSSTEVEAAGKSIPIGRSYQDVVKKEFEGF
jgi:DNA-binding LytR/AlgR family response regulator